MWWSSVDDNNTVAPASRRRQLGWAGRMPALLPILLVLGGCGFHPLYGRDSFDPDINAELASVHVPTLQDREGQLLHNALLADFCPRGEPEHPRYNLVVRTTVTEGQQALRKDDTATRDLLYYAVSYYLYDGKTMVTTGTMLQAFSYDFLEEHYANISAAEDVKRRAATSIAAEIRTRLAAYFANAAQLKRGLRPANP